VVKGPNQTNVDNLSNVRHKASRYFRNNQKEYLKSKIDELETNSKINIISHGILARSRDHFSQLLNVRGFNDISSSLVTLLKITDAHPQVSDIFDITLCFKFIKFSFQLFLLFVPEMSTSFTSYFV
jgi:hypothetical protein